MASVGHGSLLQVQRCVNRCGKQAGQPDQDQIDRDQVIEQARQDQDQNPEQQRHQGLQQDNIDMHEMSLSNKGIQIKETRNPASGRSPCCDGPLEKRRFPPLLRSRAKSVRIISCNTGFRGKACPPRERRGSGSAVPA